MKKLIIISIFILLLNCDYFNLKSNKDWLKSTNRNDPTIYIAGNYNDVSGNSYACYWIQKGNDIQRIKLSGSSDAEAYSIYMYNDNIYIAGYHSSTNACYWKNGDRTELFGEDAYKIVVVDGTLYILLNSSKSTLEPHFYNNGNIYKISFPASSTYSRCFDFVVKKDGLNNTNIFMSGYYRISGIDYPCYWINNKIETLPFTDFEAYNISVNNNNIYLNLINNNDYYYSKNDSLNYIGPEIGGMNGLQSLCVDNNDIYIAGDTGANDLICYKNNEIYMYFSGVIACGNDIKVYNNDVYLAGFYNSGVNDTACYWKNKERTFLPDDGYGSAANSIIIKY